MIENDISQPASYLQPAELSPMSHMTQLVEQTQMTHMTQMTEQPHESESSFNRKLVRGYLKEFCQAIGILNDNSFLCPTCGNVVKCESCFSWHCPACDTAGDVVDLALMLDQQLNTSEQASAYVKRVLGLKSSSLEWIDANELMQMNFPESTKLIDSILYSGVYILAGAPKTGKSWLAMFIAHCISTGKSFWNFSVSKADVLYLDLENTPKRSKKRLEKLTNGRTGSLKIINLCELYGHDLAEELCKILDKHPGIKLIVIDTLMMIKGITTVSPSYSADYDSISVFKKISDKYDVTFLIVHHTKKQMDNDPFGSIYGTYGIFGAADGAFVLFKESRTSNKGKFLGTGRDIEDFCFNIVWDKVNMMWNFVGFSPGIDFGDTELQFIYAFLTDCGGKWSGSANDLSEKLIKYNVHKNGQSLMRYINSYEDALYEFYHIKIDRHRSTSARSISLSFVDDIG